MILAILAPSYGFFLKLDFNIAIKCVTEHLFTSIQALFKPFFDQDLIRKLELIYKYKKRGYSQLLQDQV